MATPAVSPASKAPTPAPWEPVLETGDRLSRDEFERRYKRLPHIKKAELVEGIVYMPSPLHAKAHAKPHSYLTWWLVHYESETPGVESFDNSTVRLDLDNEPQPDLVLIRAPAMGGQARISKDDYIEGAPELVVEIVASSRAYDLHQKKDAYRRNGVGEYLAFISSERRLVWWQLRDGDYQEITADTDGLLKSRLFPGLWLDAHAFIEGDLKSVLAALRRGIDSSEHQAFLAGGEHTSKT